MAQSHETAPPPLQMPAASPRGPHAHTYAGKLQIQGFLYLLKFDNSLKQLTELSKTLYLQLFY